MDLCDDPSLAALFAEMNPPQPGRGVPRKHKKAPISVSYAAPSHKARARMCKCGGCFQCREAARWETIFQQKFADPLYYSPRGLPHNSPLD